MSVSDPENGAKTVDAILIAGPNGAGKTTFARSLLPDAFPRAEFINADEIAADSGGALGPVESGREMLERIRRAVATQRDFAAETTLSSKAYRRMVREWQLAGYRVQLYFIELPNADYAVERVNRRTAQGGHSIPEADIRRRFERGLDAFHTHFKPAVDIWYHLKSDDEGTILAGTNQTG